MKSKYLPSTPVFEPKPVPDPILDRKGNVLRHGDRILSFNMMADGETMEDIRRHGKRGVPATFIVSPKGMWIIDDEGLSTGCDPADPKYGVEKA